MSEPVASTNLPDRYRVANLPALIEGTRLPGLPIASQAEADRLDLRFLYSIFRRRLPLFLMTVGLCMLIALNITIVTPRLYRASADVVINKDRTELVPGAAGQGDDAPPRAEEIDTEIKVIESQELAGRVIDALQLDRDAEFIASTANAGLVGRIRLALGVGAAAPADLRRRLTDTLLAHLDASRLDTAYALRISYTDGDPARAAAIANAFAAGYSTSAASAKKAENERALAVLQGKIAQLRQLAESDFGAVQDFRVRNNLLSAQATSLAEQEAAAYAQQLAQARSIAAVDRGRAGAAAGKGEAAAVNSPVVHALRAQRATLSVRVADLSTRYLDTHPDLVTARQQLADLDSQIAAEVARARAGTSAGLGSDAVASAQQVGAMQAGLAAAQGRLAANNRALVGLDDLTRKAEASQALYESYLARYKEVLAQTGIERPQARVLTHAQAPGHPVSPNLTLNLALGLVIGVLIGAALAVATETAFSGLTTGEEVEQRLGVRYLGGVPLLTSIGLPDAAPADSLASHPGSAYAEAVRGLLAATRQMSRNRNQVIAVSSALPDEGKTSLALSLARSAALSGESVVLIDCDTVQHGLSDIVAATSDLSDDQWARRAGLREVLRESAGIEQALVRDSASEAMILPITSRFADGERLLERGNFHRLVGSLREHFGVIILDTAPILPIADTREILSLADNVVVTALWRKTSDAALRAALRLLPLHGIDDIGITLNRMDMRKQASFGGGDAAFYYDSYKKYYA